MCAIFVPACEGCTDCQRRSEAHMRTPVVHPGKPCPLPIRPAAKQKQEAARKILRDAAQDRDTVSLDQFATIFAAFAA